VRPIKSIRDLNRVSKTIVEGQWPSGQSSFESLSLEALHNQIINAALSADIVQRANVGVAEAGNSPCLTLETLPSVLALMAGAGEHLYRNRSAEAGILSPIHFPHAAGPKRRNDNVRPQSFTALQHWLARLYVTRYPGQSNAANLRCLRNRSLAVAALLSRSYSQVIAGLFTLFLHP
jgi:hypothetical protein